MRIHGSAIAGMATFLAALTLDAQANTQEVNPAITTPAESGHMIYIDQKQDDKLHKDVDGFINSTYKHAE